MSGKRRRDFAWFVVVVATIAVATSARGLWLRTEVPWWTPYAVWMALIVAGILVARPWLSDGE